MTRRLLGALAGLGLLMGASASAQTYTWPGGNGNWSTAAWTGGTFPTTGGNSTPINLVFTNSNTAYTATDDITTALNLNNIDFEGTGTGTVTVTIGSNAVPVSANLVSNGAVGPSITMNSAKNVTFTVNSTATSGTLNLGSNTLTLSGTGAGTATLGVITGTGNVVVNSGNWSSPAGTYTGSTTWTGGTTINGGTMLLASSSWLGFTSTITMNGGSLFSNGSRSGSNPLAVGAGDTVHLGSSATGLNGTLQFGASTFGAGATAYVATKLTFTGGVTFAGDETLIFDLNNSTSLFNLGSNTQVLTLNGNVTIDYLGTLGATPLTLLSFSKTSSVSLSNLFLASDVSSLGTLSLSTSGNVTSVILTSSAVPEPATWASLASGLCLLALAARRRIVTARA